MPPIVDSAVHQEGDIAPSMNELDPVNEIRIKDKLYNISEFKKRHPGGGIIKYYLGQDATDAFNAFHARSTLVDNYIKAVPSRPATQDSNANPGQKGAMIKSDQETDPLVADFEKLRQEMYAEGLFEPSKPHVWLRFIEVILLKVSGIMLFWNGWIVTGIILVVFAGGRSAYLIHETGHYTLTGNRYWDRRIEEFYAAVFIGISGAYWRNQHNKHHAMPQKLKHDIDLRTLPLVAFNKDIGKDGPRFWLRWQAYLFIPVITILVGMAWQFFLHPRHSIRSGYKFEMFSFAFRYTLAFTYVLADYTWLQSFGIYMLVTWLGSTFLLVNFALNHTHTPVVHENEKLDWVRFAAEHTVDIEHTWWCDWWMGYLNYQIEHHLYPAMPQFRNHLIVDRVKALFKKHGIEYRQLTYWQALKATFGNLNEVGRNPYPKKTKAK